MISVKYKIVVNKKTQKWVLHWCSMWYILIFSMSTTQRPNWLVKHKLTQSNETQSLDVSQRQILWGVPMFENKQYTFGLHWYLTDFESGWVFSDFWIVHFRFALISDWLRKWMSLLWFLNCVSLGHQNMRVERHTVHRGFLEDSHRGFLEDSHHSITRGWKGFLRGTVRASSAWQYDLQCMHTYRLVTFTTPRFWSRNFSWK